MIFILRESRLWCSHIVIIIFTYLCSAFHQQWSYTTAHINFYPAPHIHSPKISMIPLLQANALFKCSFVLSLTLRPCLSYGSKEFHIHNLMQLLRQKLTQDFLVRAPYLISLLLLVNGRKTCFKARREYFLWINKNTWNFAHLIIVSLSSHLSRFVCFFLRIRTT